MIFWGSGSQLKIILQLFSNDDRLKGEIFIFDPFIFQNMQKPLNSESIEWIFSLKNFNEEYSDQFFIAIGNHYGYERNVYSELLINKGGKPQSFVHKTSVFDSSVQFGNLFLAMPNVTIQPFTTIGNSCVLNTGCTLDHECKISDGVHIMGNAYIAGRVEIDSYTTIGSNATILPDLKIGKNCLIGAGSVITKNVPDNSIVYGVPGKIEGKSRFLKEKELLPGVEDLLT